MLNAEEKCEIFQKSRRSDQTFFNAPVEVDGATPLFANGIKIVS